MGLFLQLTILKGSSLSDFKNAMLKVSAEHPEMDLDTAGGHYHTYADGTGILFSSNVADCEPLTQALSEKLGRSVMLLYIYDGDQWGYYLYEKGRKLDAFNPLPCYFTDDESEAEVLKGNAEIVSTHFGVPPASIEGYLVRWTEQRIDSGEKAYPGDQFPYGDCWQMADFMNALHHPYAFEPQEEPAAAQNPTPAVEAFDTALIINDLERWIADTYVLWSGCGGGNWQLFGGYPKNEGNSDTLKIMLERDWNIKNLTAGINMVNYLVADEKHKAPATDGWDFCRGMQLLGIFYLVDFIDRKQMVEFSCAIGKIIQRHFSSWEELCESYMTGHAQWCKETFNAIEAEKAITERRTLYRNYKKMKGGPYRRPWNMPLTPVTAANGTAVQSTSSSYFNQWLIQEEKWIDAYRRKATKTILLVIMPLVIVIMAILMGVMGLIGGEQGFALLKSALPGLQVGILVTLPVLLYVMHRLGKGRMSQAIKKAVKQMDMDDCEQEKMGMEMLDALQASRGHMDYKEKSPRSQTTPARLVVSKNYFYQAGTRMHIIIIRRSDVDYIEAGQERKFQGMSTRTAQTFVIHAVYFYYRSSRERRLEGDKSPDHGMGFVDPAIRNQAFAMINQQLRVQ